MMTMTMTWLPPKQRRTEFQENGEEKEYSTVELYCNKVQAHGHVKLKFRSQRLGAKTELSL